MNRLASLILASCLFFAANPAAAQAPSQEEAPPTAEAYAPEVRVAFDEWSEAWQHIPRLISLQAEDERALSLEERLQADIKRLGEKTFSNREWRAYWVRQAATADTLAKAMRSDGGEPAAAAIIEDWTKLANDKVSNQDVYFHAIELERDALEGRLEATLELVREGEGTDDELFIEDPNPYEQRRMHLTKLDDSLSDQQQRRRLLESEIEYIDRLIETEAVLAGALEKDLELARRELALANAALTGSEADLWLGTWTTIAPQTRTKVEKIEAENDFQRSRARARGIELGLAQSKVDYRTKRIEALRSEYDAAASTSTWMKATRDTVLIWLRDKAWRVLIVLLLLVLGVRVTLRVIHRGMELLLKRADPNPDVDDDDDQRRKTLAEVFTSVARITLYIVAGLIALEQIGINTAPLMGSVAILGLAISFGSQNLVRDVVNGFFILLENQFAVGDVVSIGGKTGSVEQLTIRSTWVRSASGDLHIVPNGGISLVSNHTREWSRATCEVGVAYDCDLGKVAAIANRVGEELFADEEFGPKLLEQPAWIGVVSLGDSSVVVRLSGKVVAGEQWGVLRELNRRIKLAFDAEGIEIPFPQQVIHRAAD